MGSAVEDEEQQFVGPLRVYMFGEDGPALLRIALSDGTQVQAEVPRKLVALISAYGRAWKKDASSPEAVRGWRPDWWLAKALSVGTNALGQYRSRVNRRLARGRPDCTLPSLFESKRGAGNRIPFDIEFNSDSLDRE